MNSFSVATRAALLFLTFFGCITGHAQVDLTRGLVGCYPFSGNAKDYSPLANDGTVTGAKLVADRFGNANSAYEFDGIDDVIEISPNNLQLNNFTYSIWARPNGIPTERTAWFLFSVGSDLGDQHIIFSNLYATEELIGFSHGCYQGVANHLACTSASIQPAGKWYHLAVVKDDKNYYFYVNGKKICTESDKGFQAFYGVGTVRATIGARNNYGQASNAVIDDIHLYDRPLSQEEIDALFEGGKVPSDPVNGQIVADNKPVCAGEMLSLKVEADQVGSVFEWTVDGIKQYESSGSIQIPTLDKGADYQINVSVKVDFDRTCFKQTEAFGIDKILDVKNCTNPPRDTSMLLVPDIFTPNGDGKNDNWEISNTGTIRKLAIKVFNRWGEIIYYSGEYIHPWNGMYRGQRVSSGSYPYQIFSNEKLLRSGNVMIVY
ncbi:LamG-like jellyroll fold domain-containing protein [Dyadobacter aurulentus]|uniref:LamG-like jellyroll fold domain-containing protein n=1 Tax=Dyadobacter sp. UC 10 TaxID=2605428 RepID=UPI0011F295A8|nr:LamG-like jellyroll fold domain-containing protein [Dyadobacter sp. UC 10]KAA0992210.1 T9SS type B sorting domain-containing protein [Dyadobacter sp. UC 10]